MASESFEITAKSIIIKIFDEMESNYSNSDAHQTYREIKDNNFKLYLKTEARDWNNFKEQTNLLLHLRINPKTNKLIIEENNFDYDLELALLRAGITEKDIYVPWLDDNDARVYFTGF